MCLLRRLQGLHQRGIYKDMPVQHTYTIHRICCYLYAFLYTSLMMTLYRSKHVEGA